MCDFFSFRQRLTILKATLCLVIILGVVLVVQPSFIFPTDAHLNYPKYSYGVLLGLLCSLSTATINVSSAKAIDVSRIHLMLFGGIATAAIGAIGYYCSYIEPFFLVALLERGCMTVGVAIASIFGGHLLVIANQVKTRLKMVSGYQSQTAII